jgi:hypothetical protein
MGVMLNEEQFAIPKAMVKGTAGGSHKNKVGT